MVVTSHTTVRSFIRACVDVGALYFSKASCAQCHVEYAQISAFHALLRLTPTTVVAAFTNLSVL
jgi:hypothetical protein